MPGPVYLGKIQITWCKKCNLPILEDRTCSCDSQTIKVPLTPPGDAYPALGRSIEILRGTIDTAYGSGVGMGLLPEDKLILLNIIPSRDRAVEVVLDGLVLGRSFYEPSMREWTFKPTMEGVRRLAGLTEQKKVTADEGAVAAILRKGSLLAPGVLSADQAIMPGDEVMIQDPNGRVFSVGSARMTGPEMVKMKRGIASKVREAEEHCPPKVLKGGQSWEDAVRANEDVLRRREEEAFEFIRRVARSHKLPRCVAFSGGKDSLCTLILVAKALEDFKILFVDTGIEFPETLEYTKTIIDKMGMKDRLMVKSVGEGFWEALKVFGPPGRDARWCCKVCKLGPTTSVIQEVFGGACLTFVGQRRYESQQRLSRKRVSRNPWVPGQLAASPIREWTALHVWLYAFREKAEINPLYYRGYSRIGCFVCPASDMAEFRLLEETHPELASRLTSEITDHGRRAGMPEEWFNLGLWRWREAPGWARHDAEKPVDAFEYVDLVRLEPSRSDSGTILSGSVGDSIDTDRVMNALMPLAEVNIRGDQIVASVSGIDIKVDAEGEVTIGPSRDEKLLGNVSRRVAFCLVKARYCVGCGTCVGACPRDAIQISGGRAWIGGGCTHCASCIELCPLLTWAVKAPSRPFA